MTNFLKSFFALICGLTFLSLLYVIGTMPTAYINAAQIIITLIPGFLCLFILKKN